MYKTILYVSTVLYIEEIDLFIHHTSPKKVLLSTLTGGFNYGNRLQHFALKSVIEKQGFEVTSLVVRGEPASAMEYHVKETILSMAGRLGLHKYTSKLAKLKRREKLFAFNKSHMGTMLYMPVERVRRTNWDSYDCAVTGSDQVWHNWHWKDVPAELSYFYLDYMPVKKRVSYAPSFGFAEFPKEDLEQHRKGLIEMQALSCREQEGCDIIYALTGRKAEKVLDPTLLLTAREWMLMEQKPQCSVPDRFMVQFFLGTVSDEYLEEIEKISSERNLQVINLQDVNNPEYYGLSPLEFIWMIHHADAVCTDSFHASVFSILFSRNLRVFQRITPEYGNMFGRLHDLLEPLGLLKNIYGAGENMSTELSADAANYLTNEREKSLVYLTHSLSGE